MPGMQTIEGLSSGLDITSIVDTIMEYERLPVTILEQEMHCSLSEKAISINHRLTFRIQIFYRPQPEAGSAKEHTVCRFWN